MMVSNVSGASLERVTRVGTLIIRKEKNGKNGEGQKVSVSNLLEAIFMQYVDE